MIRNITIENFFSFGKAKTIEVNPELNILVGINGSGKSNFFKALELIRQGEIESDLTNFINKEWGGVDNVVNKSINSGKTLIECHCHIGFFENSDVSNKIELEKQFAGKFTYKFTSKFKDEKEEDESLRSLHFFNIYLQFDTSSKSPLRQLCPYYSEEYLLPSGENLAQLLSYLNTKKIKAYDKIMEALKQVNPSFKELAFTVPTGSKILMSLKEKNLNEAITVEHFSDGTLRFLLLMSILYTPPLVDGNVVCLDEPELGLHPDMIRMVAEGIKYASKNGTQMFVSTHSPLLLNHFELEDLLIFEKDEENNTVVKRKSEDDFKDWLGEFLPGKMWVEGLIGGVRW